ncbi:hypothetical protein L2E82_46025 [Cichorium intybus]|uniref:Uncharacterized protein n=1 Tax=Cichorium intybus TaxID=13427 RepID=A0ACB8YSJ4_CICIN|nr:hypothetical protein L2E82_46025 [Cichorium intybus]
MKESCRASDAGDFTLLLWLHDDDYSAYDLGMTGNRPRLLVAVFANNRGGDCDARGIESNNAEGVEPITVNVRCSNGTEFSVQVYDVSSYLEDHPGGDDVLLEVTGNSLFFLYLMN